MNNFRVLLSVAIFLLSSYFLFDLILFGFNWLLLVFSIIGFVGVHYLWPPKHDDESPWYDALELIIELPYRAMAMLVRGLGQVFKNADSGLNL